MLVLRWLGRTAALCVGLVLACGEDAQRRAGEASGGEGGGDTATAGGGGGGEPASPSAGAGAGGESGTGPTLPVDLATYCEQLTALHYEWGQHCFGEEAYSEEARGPYIENAVASCLAAEPAITAGRVAFDGVAAAACLDALTPESCELFDFIGKPECEGVFTPLVEPGGECYWSVVGHLKVPSECAGGFCDNSGQQCPGECVALLARGQACSLDGIACLPGNYCDGEACRQLPGEGEACGAEGCDAAHYCERAPQETDGTCVVRPQPGDTCSGTEPCSPGLNCVNGECHTKSDTGEVCLDYPNCWWPERCLLRAGDESPSCGPPGGEGDGCRQREDCDPDHYCSSGAAPVCTARVGFSDACTRDEECVAGAWCNQESGACQAAGAAGDDCLQDGSPAGSSEACEPGLFCMADGQCHPAGNEGEPCRASSTASCQAGLFCSRESFTCQPLAAEGEFCNPFLPQPCAGALGCLCADPSCERYGGNVNVHDTLHTCQTRLEPGDACFNSYECAEGSTCGGEEPTTCVPDPVPCLPE